MRTSRLELLLGAFWLAVLQPTNGAAAEVLISQAEASLPISVDAMLAKRAVTRGPAIEQVTPNPGASVTSPLPLKIKFIARNNTGIDPNSVKITYLKSPNIDLTDRMKAHITAAGIEMSQVEVPPGMHMLQIELRDTQGRESNNTITISVAN